MRMYFLCVTMGTYSNSFPFFSSKFKNTFTDAGGENSVTAELTWPSCDDLVPGLLQNEQY